MNDRRFRFLVRYPALVAVLMLVVMGVYAKRGWFDWKRMLRENAELKTRLDTVQREKAEVERRSAALQTDPAEQERVIRSVLGYVRPDETVIEFP